MSGTIERRGGKGHEIWSLEAGTSTAGNGENRCESSNAAESFTG